jgi:uncharacterized protein (TIGR02147 family)
VTNIFHFCSVPDFLKSELERRKSHDPKYSLRAFARDLGVSSSRLSEFLQRNDGMNAQTANKIAKALQLSFNEKQYLQLLIKSFAGRSAADRENAKKTLAEILEKKKYVLAQSGFGGLLSRWYYIPLMELLSLCNGRPKTSVARILGISIAEVNEAIAHLTLSGPLRPNGRGWQKATPLLQLESAVPSTAVKNYHQKASESAARSLNQPIENRKFLSSVLGIRRSSVSEARRDIEKFNAEFMAKYATENAAETVYGINVHFFEFAESETIS